MGLAPPNLAGRFVQSGGAEKTPLGHHFFCLASGLVALTFFHFYESVGQNFFNWALASAGWAPTRLKKKYHLF